LFRTTQIPTRPVDKNRRKMFNSGKKKRHTVKNQIMVNKNGIIIHKLDHQKGRRHDYDIYKENHHATPKQVVNVFDLGYLGVEKDVQNNCPPYPVKKETVNDLQKRKNNTTKYILKKEL
jgi:hypothetical protein